MNFRAAIFAGLIILIFSCASGPVRTEGLLDWDSDKFEEKDGKLFNAVKSGDPNRVSTALSDNPNINVSDRLGQTAFMWVCHNGNLSIINMLLSHDESKISQKAKNYKRLDIKAQSSPQKPELRYNALFCYIMSSGINPYNPEAKNTLKRIIEKDPSILDMTDYYGETVIHKLIRSNNNYFDVVIANNGKITDQKKQELLNKPSKMHSPLELATEVRNRWMVEALANVAEKGMVIKDFSNDNIPVIAFDYGNGDLEIFLNYFKGKIWDDKKRKSPPRPNNKFDEAKNRVLDIWREHSEQVTWFIEIYEKYINGRAIEDPNRLASDKYTADMIEILNLVRKPMTDVEKANFFNKLKNFPGAVYIWDNDDNKTLIQYIVEEQSVDVLESVLKLVSPYRLPRASNGYGDYLTIAMLKGKEKQQHMRFLLNKYPDFQSGINNLMNPHTIIEERLSEAIFGLPLMDPLQIFCISPLSDDKDLLAKMTRFFRPRFYDKSYCDRLVNQLVSMGKYDIFEFFLDYDESFYKINDVLINDKDPVLNILFSDQEERLARKIVNYYIRKKIQLDKPNEDTLRSRDRNLWVNYQNNITQSNASIRSGQSVQEKVEQKNEREELILPENQAQ